MTRNSGSTNADPASPPQPVAAAIRMTPDDLSPAPARFAVGGEPLKLTGGWNWGGSGDMRYIRMFDPATFSFFNVVELGTSSLASGTATQHAPVYAGPAAYSPVSGDPTGVSDDAMTWEQRSPAGGEGAAVVCTYSTRETRYVEEGLFDVTYTHLPYALAVQKDGPLGFGWLCQHGIIEGTYRGEPIWMLGGWDRAYGDLYEGFAERTFVGVSMVRVNADGTREWGFAAKIGEEGIGYYCKDGQEPIVSTDVELVATWSPLPFDEASMACTSADFRFGGIEIHYRGERGFRADTGSSAEEVLTLPPGFSNGTGDWWQGDTAPPAREVYSWMECHNARAGTKLPGM